LVKELKDYYPTRGFDNLKKQDIQVLLHHHHSSSTSLSYAQESGLKQLVGQMYGGEQLMNTHPEEWSVWTLEESLEVNS
jgi:hypothetical protein